MEVRRERELCLWKSLPPRRLVFGRRKTGKTYFVRRWGEWEEYYTVSAEGVVYTSDLEELSYDVFLERLRHQKDTPVVIDEFHRLPPKFLTFLQHISPPWILVTSTLFLAKKLLGASSPILGLFHPLRFDIISPIDVLRSLDFRNSTKLLEEAIYLREPILLDFDPDIPLEKRLGLVLPVVKGLVGEIFQEERRELTVSYLSVLRGISGGYTRPKKAMRYLQNGSFYLHLLKEMGLLKTIRIHRQKRHLYRHSSPLFDLYFYLSSKYLYDETGYFKPEVVRQLLPVHLEWFLEDLLLEVYSLEPVKVLYPEVDVALVRNKRIEIAVEVKWRDDIDKRELKEIEKKLLSVRAKRRILFVKDPSGLDSNKIEIWGPEDIVMLARSHRFC